MDYNNWGRNGRTCCHHQVIETSSKDLFALHVANDKMRMGDGINTWEFNGTGLKDKFSRPRHKGMKKRGELRKKLGFIPYLLLNDTVLPLTLENICSPISILRSTTIW